MLQTQLLTSVQLRLIFEVRYALPNGTAYKVYVLRFLPPEKRIRSLHWVTSTNQEEPR